ncbi:MAG: host-nuclease inhibitor Gam family protein [Bryobacteraceae bacterium]|nr:host-nuclease inhibitor Gam family protein [Bryobacteraceae bacterium]
MLNEWKDADETLREIAVIDVVLGEASGRRQESLLVVEEAYKRETAHLVAKKGELVTELEAFYKANRKKVEADGRRSIDLFFGRLGMRKGKPTLALAKGWKWERVLYAIKERWSKNKDLLESLVTTKESVNKEGCKSRLDEEKLALVGLKVKQEDEFYYETFPEKVEESRPAA